VRDSLTSEDPNEIRTKTDALQTAFQSVSEQLYQAAAAEQQAAGDGASAENGAGADGSDGGDEVVDAEVVDDEASK
jgi:molecular chaperone DnaK